MFLGLFNRHLTTTVAQSGNEGHGQAGNGSGGSQTGTRLSQFAQCGERARLCTLDEALSFGTELADLENMQAAAFVFAIKLGFIVAAGLQEFDAFLAEFDHLVTWTEVQSPRLASLDAGWKHAVFQTIPAHCALVDLRLIAVVTGNVERAGHFAVAAADALFGRNGDNTVFFVLQTTRRADRNAAGVGAVEAGTASESHSTGRS